jgi:hypothetical protein
MAQFIRSVVDFTYKRALEPRISQGQFSILNSITATVTNKIGTFHSNIDALVDFQCTGLKVRTFVTDTTTSYAGYNKKYIRDDGTYDPIPAFEEFAKNPVGRKISKEDASAIIKGMVMEDCHEPFIYNMLVSWYKAKLYKDTHAVGDLLILKQSGLSDAHVKQQYYGEPDHTKELQMGHPNPNKSEVTLNFRGMVNYWEYPYVLRYSTGSKEQTGFYLSHLNGREGNTGLNVDITLPGIDTSLLCLDPVGLHEYMSGSYFEDIPWTKPELLWSWIMDYVQLNRVEHAFAAAFEMLGSLSMQPINTYHEGVMWHEMETQAVFGAFRPTRGKVRTNLEGKPTRRILKHMSSLRLTPLTLKCL